MDILITGDARRWEEFQATRNTDGHNCVWEPELQLIRGETDVVIDLSLDERPENLMLYSMKPEVPVLGCLVKTSPSVWEQYPHIYGVNWLLGFIGMSPLETALSAAGEAPALEALMKTLGWAYETVRAATGMVTPRVVAMIINEAYFTAAEGTASREDIDISMKLGTNYPYGPFEWSKKAGIRNIYEVLQAVYRETGNERYKPAPLLREEYEALPF
ncbi:3-hydroxyacyl-CoA dehydrogenase family protein [Chitinophaga barathri]|uniref:3-hydroxyacyl-CoA dehydrogenase n=1 Tax=Chitinophaga barathri TaxID=1647451 RepID=A0A3N4M9L8_9BACT|nr:3-hydroxyacyl-CoA dehydrogenase family protein [Chitinophaga barathri]RPD40221.1 3-hydroxyacyl-CoA dehydrogenase [Chitinophaga barathri]